MSARGWFDSLFGTGPELIESTSESGNPAFFVYPSRWPECRGMVEFRAESGDFRSHVAMVMKPDQARAFASTILHQADLAEGMQKGGY